MRSGAASADQVCIGQTATRNLRHDFVEPLMVCDVDPIVEPEHLFVKVTV